MPEQPSLSYTRERAEVLRRLHIQPDLLVLVNVWDVASATAVAAVPGSRAVATASAAIAAGHGYPDGERIPVEHACHDRPDRHRVDLPTTADGAEHEARVGTPASAAAGRRTACE